uniref:C2H2-type domain-containing protein n=1 Tax=Panagrolaimus superbus TaxID=310955 RepID=A0A914Z1F3_9BILA
MYAIAATDPPLLFNKFLATQRGIIGAEHVAQVICQDNPDFETYLCRTCEYWNTPGAMITHLKSEKHQLNHMRKKFKDQFHKIQVARKRNRQGLIDQYIKYISLVEIPKIEKRMKAALNVEILLKIWPKFLQELDESWKNFEGMKIFFF